ncbi:MAG: sensor domain-containing diguanylate cyclase [Aquihabitans sp.]
MTERVWPPTLHAPIVARWGAMGAGALHQDLNDVEVRSVLDALPDLVAVVDSSGEVRWINERGLEICGVRRGDLEPMTIWDVLDPEDYDMAILGMSLSVADDHRPPGQFELRRPDGTRVRVEVFSRSVELGGEECVLVIARQLDYRLEEQIIKLIQGEPFEQVVEQALSQIRERWVGHLVAISTIDAAGGRIALGDELPERLSPLATSADGSLPWERAARGSVEIHVGLEELDDATADAARAFGVDSCGVAPLEDPLGPPACLVTWRRVDRPLQFDRVWLRSTEVNLIRLALVRRAAHLALELAAVTDPLTGLHNRTVLFDRLSEPVHGPSGRAVLFLDLDGFKPINDSLGHGTGDRLLNLVARRLELATREGDLVARMGGDEFAVLASSIGSREHAIAVARRIVEVMDAPFEVAADIDVSIDVSVGVAVDLAGTEPADHIVDRADAAMYAAKRSPGSRYYVAADEPQTSPSLTTRGAADGSGGGSEG